MLFLVGGWMLKRRRNARCTAGSDTVSVNSRTQIILCCKVAILPQLTLLHGCVLGELSSGDIWKFRTSSFKCYVDYSHTVYSSGNIEVGNWVHLFESPCIIKSGWRGCIYWSCPCWCVYVALFGSRPMNHNWLFQQSVTLASTDNELPEDGVTAPRHVGAILTFKNRASYI